MPKPSRIKYNNSRWKASQWESLCKRVTAWIQDDRSISEPSIAMFYMKDGQTVFKGAPHMTRFGEDDLVQKKFAECALTRPYGPANEAPTERDDMQRPIRLPSGDPLEYTTPTIIKTLSRILARYKVPGTTFTADKRPIWWPVTVPFMSLTNPDQHTGAKLRMEEYVQLLGSYLEMCPQDYTVVRRRDVTTDEGHEDIHPAPQSPLSIQPHSQQTIHTPVSRQPALQPTHSHPILLPTQTNITPPTPQLAPPTLTIPTVPTPTQTLPIPKHTLPTQTLPMHKRTLPTQILPMHKRTLPTQTLPMHKRTLPTQILPMHKRTLPTQTLPMHKRTLPTPTLPIPKRTLPTQTLPTQTLPTQTLPMHKRTLPTATLPTVTPSTHPISTSHLSLRHRQMKSYAMQPAQKNILLTGYRHGQSAYYPLTTECLASCLRPIWLTDDIMNVYTLAAILKSQEHISYIPCSVILLAFKGEAKLNVAGHTRVLCYLNYNENHWILLIASMHARILIIVDPLHNTERGELAEQLVELWRSAIDTDDAWRHTTVDHPVQADYVSCGVYALVIAQRVVNGEDFREKVDVQRCRATIFDTIIAATDENMVEQFCRYCKSKRPATCAPGIWVECHVCGMFFCHKKCVPVKDSFLESGRWRCPLCMCC